MILFTTRNFIKHLMTGTSLPTRLGRWEHRQPNKQQEFKQLWVNSDHCGDIICGKPELIKMNANKKKK